MNSPVPSGRVEKLRGGPATATVSGAAEVLVAGFLEKTIGKMNDPRWSRRTRRCSGRKELKRKALETKRRRKRRWRPDLGKKDARGSTTMDSSN